MQKNGDKSKKKEKEKKKRSQSNISDTAVFSGQKGVSMETELFLPASFICYIFVDTQKSSSQIDNTKACIAVKRGVEVQKRGPLSVHFLRHLLLHFFGFKASFSCLLGTALCSQFILIDQESRCNGWSSKFQMTSARFETI